MRLRIVLDEQEVVLSADFPDSVRIGAASVEVNNHHSLSALGNGLFDEAVVNLQRVEARLYEHGLQAAVGDGEDGGDEGVGRHNDLVALVQTAHLDVGAQDEPQRVEAVTAADAMSGADVLGVVLLKQPCSLATEIPAAL